MRYIRIWEAFCFIVHVIFVATSDNHAVTVAARAEDRARRSPNLKIRELALFSYWIAGMPPRTQDRQGTLNPSKPWWSCVQSAILLGSKIAKVLLKPQDRQCTFVTRGARE